MIRTSTKEQVGGLRGDQISKSSNRHQQFQGNGVRSFDDVHTETAQLCHEIDRRLSKMGNAAFRFCVDQWLLRTYVPLWAITNRREHAGSIADIPIEAYQHRYAIGAEESRPSFAMVASDPRQIDPNLVEQFRRYVKSHNGFVGYVFSQGPVPADLANMPTQDRDYSVLIVSGDIVAGMMVDKGIGVRLDPIWQIDGPRLIVDESYFSTLNQSRRES